MASDASGRPRKQRQQPAPTARQAARKGLAGPSTDPATNLLLTDIALRGATVFARLAIEHALLRNRYDATTATTIIATITTCRATIISTRTRRNTSTIATF